MGGVGGTRQKQTIVVKCLNIYRIESIKCIYYTYILIYVPLEHAINWCSISLLKSIKVPK